MADETVLKANEETVLKADETSVSTRDAIKNTRITVRESQQIRRLQALNRQQEVGS